MRGNTSLHESATLSVSILLPPADLERAISRPASQLHKTGISALSNIEMNQFRNLGGPNLVRSCSIKRLPH